VEELWRAARRRWTHDGDAIMREIEQERDDWDRRILP
jgi:hypothetical protein